MRYHLLVIARLRKGPERDLYDDYARRIRIPIDLREFEDKGRADKGRRGRESDSLLEAIPAGATVVALDERGRDLTSVEFAGRLGRWRDEGGADIAFLIGGADGLDERVRDRADLTLALGRLTWPHLMTRVLLVEQIYRAQEILAGHPYHRA